MKKYIVSFLVIAILATSCLDDDKIDFSYDNVPIEQVDIPDKFIRGQTTQISVSYFRPSDCHSFSDFNYYSTANKRAISVINVVLNNATCEDLEQTDKISQSFNFLAGSKDSYIFKFWQGFDADGTHRFLTIEVPVVE